MIIEKLKLYTRDKLKNIRILEITLEQVNDSEYVIQRNTGLLDGKLVSQPLITINKGKVKRTILQQAQLEFNSIVNKQKDKGYVIIDSDDKFIINNSLPIIKKSSLGITKPMLAHDPKAGSKPKEDSFFDNKNWFISYKLDGLRCKGVLNDTQDKINFYTRTGKLLKGSVNNFEKNPVLINFMKKYNVEIDGEIYAHGVSLNYISGDVRKETYDPQRHDYLKYYIFDCPDLNTIASERFRRLDELELDLGLLEKHLVVVKHKLVNTYKEIMAFHDDAISKGYEGAMVLSKDSLYQFGTRSRDMWKIKLFQDAEFKITGYKLGLRGAEDMCFILETDEGASFEAKPQGNKELKDFYVENFDQLKGKMGTVKFFNWTAYGVPNLPSFKCVREE